MIYRKLVNGSDLRTLKFHEETEVFVVEAIVSMSTTKPYMEGNRLVFPDQPISTSTYTVYAVRDGGNNKDYVFSGNQAQCETVRHRLQLSIEEEWKRRDAAAVLLGK